MAGPISVGVVVDSRRAESGLDRVRARAAKLGSAVRKAAIPATAALVGLGKGAYDAAQAAAADDAAQTRLAQALQKTAGGTKQSIAATEDWIAKQGMLLGVTDDELRPAIEQLATATGSVSKAQELAALAMDISARRGIPLEAVTKKIAKAQVTGKAASLAQFGVRVKEGKQARELGDVLGDLSEKYKGAAASAAGTAAGQQKKLGVQMGELQEQIGTGLLPVLSKLTGLGLKVVGYFQQNEGVAKTLAIALGVVAVSVLAVNAAMAINPAVLLAVGIGLLVAGLVRAYQTSQSFRTAVQGIATYVQTNVLPALQDFGVYLKDRVLPAVLAFADAAAARMLPILRDVGEFIQTKVIPAVRDFGDFLRDRVAPAVAETAEKVGQKLKPVLTAIGEFISGSLIPTLQKIATKFREWQPTIQDIAEVVVKLIAKQVELVATIAGKVLPVILKFAGFILREGVPAVLSLIETVAKIIGKMIEFGRAVVDRVKDVAKFVSGLKTKFGEAVAFVRTIPLRIKTALGNLGSALLQAGKDLIQGFVNGIGSMFGTVQNKLGNLTDKLTSWKGPPERDARLLRPAGRIIIAGLVRGFQDGADGVEKYLGKLTDLIQTRAERLFKIDKDGTRASRAALAGLRDQYAALTANGKAQDRIAQQLDAARDRYADLVKQAKDYAAAVKSAVIANASVVGLGQNEDTKKTSIGQLISDLGQKLLDTNKFARLIEQLRGKLNDTSLQQIIDAGVSGGLATAEAIASGGAGAIAQINALTANIAAVGGKLGQSVSNEFFASGIKAADGVVEGLRKQARRLDAIADRLAQRLLSSLLKSLEKLRRAAIAANAAAAAAAAAAEREKERKKAEKDKAKDKATPATARRAAAGTGDQAPADVAALLGVIVEILRSMNLGIADVARLLEMTPADVAAALGGAMTLGLREGRVTS